jgi:hypothetical protein
MRKGKLVYCQETFQVFPSAKVASEHHKIGYAVLTKHLEGVISTAKGKHFVYIENTADLSNFFAEKIQEANRKETMRKQAEERLNKLLEAEQSMREQQAKIAKELSEARKMMKKYM